MGRGSEEDFQQVLLVFVQQRVPSPAGLVLKRLGVVGLAVRLDPVVDGLPGDAEHASDISGRPAVVVFQDGEGTPQQAGIRRLDQLTPEALPLPASQVQVAHACFSAITGAIHEQMPCQINSAVLLRPGPPGEREGRGLPTP